MNATAAPAPTNDDPAARAAALGLANARLWTQGVPVDAKAVEQIRRLESLPLLAGPVAVMPDVHVGIGATVGTVLATRAAVIPAAVGVDIGCGMCAARTTLTAGDLPDELGMIRSAIEARVPVGFDMHASALDPASIDAATDHGAPARRRRADSTAERDALAAATGGDDAGDAGTYLGERMRALSRRWKGLRIRDRLGRGVDEERIWRQAGSLGGGNHFIELCLDEDDAVWVMLHSGSRGVGNAIGHCAIETARQVAQRLDRRLPDRDLAWLDQGTREFDDYIAAMQWAQDYAALNRDLMMRSIQGVLARTFGARFALDGEVVNCHHNFTSLEAHGGERVWVTRKGAVSARAGQAGIIPGSMGARSYIVRGRGNPQSWCSCSHGAGRTLSRTEAKKRFGARDVVAQTRGVECRKDAGVADEIPAAYKDIDAVMDAQASLVDKVATLRQVLCVKG